jgi:DNA-binding NarL/FixJ family response regulator
MTANEQPVRVVLADGQTIYREGLRHLLTAEAGLQVVGCADAALPAIARCREERAHVLLTDWRLPDLHGEDLIERLSAESPHTRAVLLVEEPLVTAEEGIRAGAWGFLPRNSTAETIAHAARSVAAGQIWASREVLARLVRQEYPVRRARRRAILSCREAEVLLLVAAGHSNETVAEMLFVELSTVKTHLIRVYRKLGVSDRTSAVVAAAAAGCISLPRR